MTWLDKLEKRFGCLAIPHMLRYVALLNGLVFVLISLNPHFQHYLTLDPTAIMGGQVWRLVSHIFIPNIGGVLPSWLQCVFYLMFLNWLGEGLEEALGAFALNVYYVLGMLGTTAAAFLTSQGDGGFLLNNSLLFAFAWMYPNLKVYVFLILPLKVKWLAWIDACLVVLYFVTPGWSHKLGVLASLTNFAVFFIPKLFAERRFKKDLGIRRERFEGAASTEGPLHSCVVCFRTEQTAPEAEFRVARDGCEYCTEHLPRTP